MEKITELKPNSKNYFAFPVDFTNIEINKYAQQMLLQLKSKTNREIREIVLENMKAIAEKRIRIEMRKMEKVNENIEDQGYFNASNIRQIWMENSLRCCNQVMQWLENQK